jgi:hypothetical protein
VTTRDEASEREAFEKWAPTVMLAYPLDKDDAGRYRDQSARCAWAAWLARARSTPAQGIDGTPSDHPATNDHGEPVRLGSVSSVTPPSPVPTAPVAVGDGMCHEDGQPHRCGRCDRDIVERPTHPAAVEGDLERCARALLARIDDVNGAVGANIVLWTSIEPEAILLRAALARAGRGER